MARKEAGWLDVFKAHGEWKIVNHRGNVVATEDRKAKAVDTARFKSNVSTSGSDYYYLGAVIYNTDGTIGEIIVGSDNVRHWLRRVSDGGD